LLRNPRVKLSYTELLGYIACCFLLVLDSYSKKRISAGGARAWILEMIFRPKKEAATGDCRELHNSELHDLRSSGNIIYLFLTRQPPVAQGLLIH
jgi:hypothetical protein